MFAAMAAAPPSALSYPLAPSSILALIRRLDKVVHLCALAKPIRQRSPRDALAGDGRDKRKKK